MVINPGPVQESYLVYAYLENPITITTTPLNTYVPIAGPFVNSFIEQWQVILAQDSICYIGAEPIVTVMYYNGSFQTDTPSTTFATAIKQNGVILPGSVCISRIASISGWRTASSIVVTPIVSDDLIQLVVKSDKDGAQLTAHTFSTALARAT